MCKLCHRVQCVDQFLFSSFFFSFQTSLASLMTTLGQSHPYFVRCVKPNEKKVCPAVSAFFNLCSLTKSMNGRAAMGPKMTVMTVVTPRENVFLVTRVRK